MENMFHPNGIREISFNLSVETIKMLKNTWKNSLIEIQEYKNKTQKRGIVICGGGEKYFSCLWVNINLLRSRGCSLPIELWYLDNELSDPVIKDLLKLEVKCINANTLSSHPISGYMIKPFAILNSEFEELLYLDADNICIKNPEPLFSNTEYLKYGAMFWPDFWKTARDNPIWTIMGVKYKWMNEQESGQLIINRKKCWKELNLCMHLNIYKNVYYRLLLGDKDTFRFAWMALKRKFYFVKKEPSSGGYLAENGKFIGHTMIQYLPDNTPMFLHRNLLKWGQVQNKKDSWELVKKFCADSNIKKYEIGYSKKYRHFCIDLMGDVVTSNFKDEFGTIEEECLQVLLTLPKISLY